MHLHSMRRGKKAVVDSLVSGSEVYWTATFIRPEYPSTLFLLFSQSTISYNVLLHSEAKDE